MGHPREVWSKKEALRELRSFIARFRRPPKLLDATSRNGLPTWPAIKRIFGSWRGCLRTLGYSPEVNRHWVKWTEEQAKDQLRAFVQRRGRPPKLLDLGKKNQLPSWPVVKRLFGDLNKYRQACGYPARWSHRPWTRQELIKIIHKIYREVRRPPTLLDLGARAEDGLPNVHVFRRVFGSWDTAVRAAGYDLNEHQLFWRRWQRIVVRAAIALYGRHDVQAGRVEGISGSVDCYIKSKRLVIDAMTSSYEHRYKAGEIARYSTGGRTLEFWCAVRGIREYKAPRLRYRYSNEIAHRLEAAGHRRVAREVREYGKKQPALYTDDHLLRLIRQLAKRLGRTPHLRDFTRDPEMPRGELIFRRFGTLEEACRRARVRYVPPPNANRYSREDLLGVLRKSWKQLGRVPTVSDFGNRKGRPSVQAIARVFGTWNKALTAASIPPLRPRYEDSELVELYRMVTARNHGRPPTSKEWDRLRKGPSFRRYSLPSSRTIIERLTWPGLKRRCGLSAPKAPIR